jgi:tryptophanyl-tRNA synthetase
LDGSGKMGKSEGNAIYLSEDPAVIRKKIMRAVTDTGPTEPNSPVSEPVNNLFTLLSLVAAPERVDFYKAAYADCSIRYGDLKKELAEEVLSFVAPIQERIREIGADDAYIRKVLSEGAEKARLSSSKTLREVREIMGF